MLHDNRALRFPPVPRKMSGRPRLDSSRAVGSLQRGVIGARGAGKRSRAVALSRVAGPVAGGAAVAGAEIRARTRPVPAAAAVRHAPALFGGATPRVGV